MPALVAYRTLRAVQSWLRTRTGSPGVLLAVPWLSLVWSAGELFGSWSRDADRALRGVSDVEHQRQPAVDSAREPIRRPWDWSGPSGRVSC